LEKHLVSNQDTSPEGNAAVQGRHASNIVELSAALLMALATIASAWCGYQSTRWNGKQSILVGETAALRFEATRKLTLAGQEAVIDINTFEQFHRALIENRTEYAQRILQRFRPEARVAVDAWLATDPFNNPSAPTGPFRMKEYRPRLAEEANALDQEANRKFSQAREANTHVDRYTMVTIMLASVLFFAGLATHFASARMQGAVLLLGLLLFLGTLIVLIAFPVA
jgi:hypothetical protein